MNDPAMAWMQAARAGDEGAACRLVDEYHGRIYAFLRRLSGGDSDAVELTQRTFCRAWTALPSFEGRSSVSTWFHGIAYRTYVDWLRSHRRQESRPDAWWEAIPDASPGPDRVAADADASAAVYGAVDTLESDLREAVHLHYYQGLTLDETAEVLGIAASTVKHRLREALGRVRRHLARADRPSPNSQPSTPLPQP